MVLHDFLCGRVGHRQGPFPKATTLVVAFFVFGVMFRGGQEEGMILKEIRVQCIPLRAREPMLVIGEDKDSTLTERVETPHQCIHMIDALHNSGCSREIERD